MTEEALRLEVAKRNARLRAWKGSGVPLGGRPWEIQPSPSGWYVRARLGCWVCRKGFDLVAHATKRRGLPSLVRELAGDERRAAEGLDCSHLEAFTKARKDPPEVLAIYELELLAA
jgi:hypothetical protein